MKIVKIIISIYFVFILSACNSGSGTGNTSDGNNASEAGVAEIVFRDYEHDFGKVTEGEKIAYVFSFENKGPGNLVINSTSTSCGCTVTKYSSKPISAGEHGTLEVAFNTSGRSGMQTKTISVHSNTMTPVVVLKITAEVIQKSAGQ